MRINVAQWLSVGLDCEGLLTPDSPEALVVSLSKILYPRLITGSTQEDKQMFRHD